MQRVAKGCVLDACIRTKRVRSLKKHSERERERDSERGRMTEKQRRWETERALGEAATSQCTPFMGTGRTALRAIESVTASSRFECVFACTVVIEFALSSIFRSLALSTTRCACAFVWVWFCFCLIVLCWCVSILCVCFWFCSCIFDICFFCIWVAFGPELCTMRRFSAMTSASWAGIRVSRAQCLA